MHDNFNTDMPDAMAQTGDSPPVQLPPEQASPAAEQPQQPMTEPQSSPPPSSGSKKMMMIILGVIILLILAGVGVFAYMQMQKTTEDHMVMEEPSPTATATADPTSGWKTYTNSYWGFSIKYPPTLKICDGYSSEQEGVRLWKSTFNCPTSTDSFYEIGVVGHAPGEYKDYKEPSTSKPTTVGGQTATEKVFTYTEADGPLFGLGSSTDVVLETDKGTLEFQLLNKDQKTFDQILSTFEFSGPDTSLELDQNLPNPVTSPLSLSGTVETGWMFEGKFTAKLLDENRNVITQATATESTPGSWTSGERVKFNVDLEFETNATKGFLVFSSDNPSGLAENEKTKEFSVNFK